MSRAKRLLQSMSEVDSKKWVENRANELVNKAWQLFTDHGNMGQVVLIYKQHEIDVIHDDNDVPVGWKVAIQSRANVTKSQLTHKFQTEMRRLPILPKEMM